MLLSVGQSTVSSSHPVLPIPQGGTPQLGAALHSLWQQAAGRDLGELAHDFHVHGATQLQVRAAFACLAEAGLLLRNGETRTRADPPRTIGDPVSVITVTYNSVTWLPACLDSVIAQTHSPLEIIVVDNASSDGSADWVAAHFPQARIVRLTARQSLAHAINRGIDVATGKYWFILNPDTRLEPDAIAQMITVAEQDVACAAVAPKLRFTWAPGFLNGIGNHVGAWGWGTDNGLGHLDLGQFDAWREVPSACFAAALIPRAAWEKIGVLDEAFPLYYEDNEWCYRARLLGYTIRVAPRAWVYHAFSAHVPSGATARLSAEKLQNVVYGRLRFAVKILTPIFLVRFSSAYAIEDCVGFLSALLRRDRPAAQAYWNAWRDFLSGWLVLWRERRALRIKRLLPDRALFDSQKEIPMPLIRNGLPELTWDLVQNHYLPLILSGATRALPEFADVDMKTARQEFVRPSLLARAFSIWRDEGWRVLLHRIKRHLQWRLALV